MNDTLGAINIYKSWGFLHIYLYEMFFLRIHIIYIYIYQIIIHIYMYTYFINKTAIKNVQSSTTPKTEKVVQEIPRRRVRPTLNSWVWNILNNFMWSMAPFFWGVKKVGLGGDSLMNFGARKNLTHQYSRWWFQIFFIFTPKNWGRFPFWPIFFKGVETTN